MPSLEDVEMVYEDGDEPDSGIDYPEEEEELMEEDEYRGVNRRWRRRISNRASMIEALAENIIQQLQEEEIGEHLLDHVRRPIRPEQRQCCTICCEDFTDDDKDVLPPCADPDHRVWRATPQTGRATASAPTNLTFRARTKGATRCTNST